MSTQQQASAGDYSPIIQIFGDHNVVGDRPHLTIHCPPQERSEVSVPAKDEAILLRPGVEATEFVGRSNLLDDFATWAQTHDPNRPVSVRVVHGGAGVGKTRFALELCRALGSDWQAGFVPGKEARRFLGQTNLANWGWQKSTFVVFDYALSLVDVLPDWTRELCAVTQRPHPLRILLLERQAEEQSGWLEQAFPGGFGFDATGPRDLLDGPPTLLPGLSTPRIQRGIMQNMLARLGSQVVLPPDNSDFQARLAATDWAGAPLYLMMAAMVMHQQGGVGEVLDLGRVDLAQFVAEHEYERLRRPCGGKRSLEILLPHMAALATLCSGIEADALSPRIQREREALGCNDVDMATTRELLAGLLPDGNEGVAPILPDIVGEAFVLERLAGGRQTEGRQAVLRAFGERPSEVAAVLVRCVQDFVPRLGRGATGQMVKAQQRAMEWLRELGEMPELPLTLLFTLIDALPDQTEALLTLALDWQSRIVADLKTRSTDSNYFKAILAANLTNLSIRLNNAGKRDDALVIAHESALIHKELSKLSPNNYKPAYATSISNLSNGLSEVGKHKDALEHAYTAVTIYRELVKQNKKLFKSELGRCIINLSTMLKNVGDNKHALLFAEEAVHIYTELSNYNNDIFNPELAGSLNNLANRLSGVGRIDDALIIAQKSVLIYRDLAQNNPDSFRENLAGSLNNYAVLLSNANHHSKSLVTFQESLKIRRDLAILNPEAFSPGLAMCLNNYSNSLNESKKFHDALTISQESTELYRSLAEKHPDTFLPYLAGSLGNLTNRLIKSGQRHEALQSAQKSARIFCNLAEQLPEVFRQDAMTTIVTWLSLRHNISWEEAFAMLQQDPQSHLRALLDDPDESSPSDTSTPPEGAS